MSIALGASRRAQTESRIKSKVKLACSLLTEAMYGRKCVCVCVYCRLQVKDKAIVDLSKKVPVRFKVALVTRNTSQLRACVLA